MLVSDVTGNAIRNGMRHATRQRNTPRHESQKLTFSAVTTPTLTQAKKVQIDTAKWSLFCLGRNGCQNQENLAIWILLEHSAAAKPFEGGGRGPNLKLRRGRKLAKVHTPIRRKAKT